MGCPGGGRTQARRVALEFSGEQQKRMQYEQNKKNGDIRPKGNLRMGDRNVCLDPRATVSDRELVLAESHDFVSIRCHYCPS